MLSTCQYMFASLTIDLMSTCSRSKIAAQARSAELHHSFANKKAKQKKLGALGVFGISSS